MSEKNNLNVDKLPDENDELFGRVTNMLGASRLKVRCEDSEERLCRIPGRMKNKVWIEEGDLIIVEPWDWQDEKGDVTYKYDEKQVMELKEEGLINLDTE